MPDLASSIWRDHNTEGDPGSGAHKPLKSKIREWGAWVEGKFLQVFAPAQGGSDGGEVVLEKPPSGTTLSGNVAMDVYASVLRFSDTTSGRGATLNITALATSVASSIAVDTYEGKTFAALFGFSTSATAAQNKTALDAAIASAISTGRRRVILPSGTFQINNLATITDAHCLTIEGSGQYDGGFFGGTILSVQTASGEFIRFETSQHAGIKGVYIRHDVRRTADYSIVFANGCFHPFADVRIDYGYNGVRVWGTGESDINVMMRYMYGVVGVLYDGDSSNWTLGATLKIESDNPYPLTGDAPRKTFSASLAVDLNDILWCPTSGIIYQVTTAGTLAATEPSTIAGVTGPEGFTTSFISGTAEIRFVARALRWVVIESYAYSIRIRKGSHVINGHMGLSIQDASASAPSRPKWIYFEGETDHSFSHGVFAERGESLYLEGAWLGSSLTGSGLHVASTWTKDVSADPAVRLAGNWLHGAYVAATTNVRIIGSTVEDNSQSAVNGSDGVYFDGTQRFQIGQITSLGARQRYGIGIAAGSNYYSVIGNNLGGNSTGTLLNTPGTSANVREVVGNIN